MMSYCSNCGNELVSDEGYCTSCGTKATTGTNAKIQSGAKHFWYDELPDHVKHKLFSRQNANLSKQIKVKIQGIIPSYIWAAILILWIPFLFYLSDDSQWSSSSVFWLSLITIVDSILFYRAIRFVIKWRKSVLKCNFYLTPLYFIKTYLNEIWCWGVWTIKDFKVTHNYRNGAYQDSSANLIFPNFSEQLTFASEEEVQKFFNTIKYFVQQIADAQSKRNWQYFFEHDDFYDIPASKSAAMKARQNSVYMQYALAVCVGILISIGSYYNNLRASHRYHEIASRKGNNQQLTRSRGSIPQRDNNRQLPQSTNLIPQFNEPEKPLPYNGMVKNYTYEDCEAPLKIVTNSDMHYYVKITDWHTNRLVQTIFIRAGGTVETKVPLGSYKIKYAVGKTWYGEIHRFGPSTVYSEADNRFNFEVIGDQISGYTVELFLQRDGNLETMHISASEF
jgi:hypothetical protein